MFFLPKASNKAFSSSQILSFLFKISHKQNCPIWGSRLKEYERKDTLVQPGSLPFYTGVGGDALLSDVILFAFLFLACISCKIFSGRGGWSQMGLR